MTNVWFDTDGGVKMNVSNATLEDLRRAVAVMRDNIHIGNLISGTSVWSDQDVDNFATLGHIIGIINDAIGEDWADTHK